jgi:hypothetical protein
MTVPAVIAICPYVMRARSNRPSLNNRRWRRNSHYDLGKCCTRTQQSGTNYSQEKFLHR